MAAFPLLLAAVYTSCPLGCSNQGACVDDVCQCYPGFQGPDCGTRLSCPNDCSGQGFCHNATCTCYPGFFGHSCSIKLCPNFCSHRGDCVDGSCVCHANFSGAACEHARCPNDCTAPGRFERCSDEGLCVCKPGFSGLSCEHASTAVCNERGVVAPGSGKCVCESEWTGDHCELPRCPKDCHGRGLCIGGGCYCAPGFGGHDCGELTCECHGGNRTLKSISPHDIYEPLPTAQSHAFSFASLNAVKDRSLTSPANHFLGLAVTAVSKVLENLTETCACECYTYERSFGVGPVCTSPCPRGCAGHGQCDKDTGTCTCDVGWEGIGCDKPDCSKGRSGLPWPQLARRRRRLVRSLSLLLAGCGFPLLPFSLSLSLSHARTHTRALPRANRCAHLTDACTP